MAKMYGDGDGGYEWTDYYKDDRCHGCRYAVEKKDGDYGLFSRRYGCNCPDRVDFVQRDADIAERLSGGLARRLEIINELWEVQTDADKYSRYGYIEPTDTFVCPYGRYGDDCRRLPASMVADKVKKG